MKLRTLAVIVLLGAVLSMGAVSSYTTATVERDVSVSVVADGDASLELAGSETLNRIQGQEYELVQITNRFSDTATVTVTLTGGNYEFRDGTTTKKVTLSPGSSATFNVQNDGGRGNANAEYTVDAEWAGGAYSATADRVAQNNNNAGGGPPGGGPPGGGPPGGGPPGG